MEKKKIFTVPNMLGFYRIMMFPILLAFALTERETLFAVFLVINLLTDVADGYIARKFNMETEFGAKLDSMADNLTYVAAFTGIYVFKLEDFMPHITSFLIFIGFLILAITVSLIKFGRFPSLHLYSWKIGGYIQGAFFILLFTYGFYTPFYYFMIAWGIISAIEHITIQMIIPEMRSNAKGLYWVLKDKKKGHQNSLSK
ncbi:MAG: CDP-alcohol phosphatidyltransferase family protein [Bacteroidetes bacterium]|nr:MAG: CDP-alcohol phosphatidyltransferase family protein [Bacteroidota bacterium]